MFSTGDTLSIVFGIVGTIVAVGTFWVTRNTTRRPIDTVPDSDQDVELGLLNLTSPQAPLEPDSNAISPSTVGHEPATDRYQLHEVIGDALEVFSRHLRASH